MGNYKEITRKWVAEWVIGLNLCPFAGVPFRKNLLRYALTVSESPEEVMQLFLKEISLLYETPASELETTMLIHPNALTDFGDYLEFTAEAESLIEEIGLQGMFQVATFHPHYVFADAPPDDPANYTNRSPFPMLHLLREDSITDAVANFPDIESIPELNTAHLRRLGIEKIREIQAGIKGRRKNE